MLKVRINGNVIRADNRADAERIRTNAEKLHEAKCYNTNGFVGSAPPRPVVRILSIPSNR